MSVAKLPIAELFTSPQGEGFYCGALMSFIRLAGCTVGRPYPATARQELGLQIYQERCTDWNGDSFSCDTNYKLSKKMTIEEILHESHAPRLCITGGEPLMHDLEELIKEAFSKGKKVHIETSGTISTEDLRTYGPVWITISPKQNYLPETLLDANEIKVLVGYNFNEQHFQRDFGALIESGKLWIQPINYETQIDGSNMQRCLDLQHKYPMVRISSQIHKIWNCR